MDFLLMTSRFWSVVQTAVKLVFTRLLPLAAWGLDLLIWKGDDKWIGGESVPIWLVPVTSAIVCATLVIRQQRPLLIFGIQFVWVFAASVFMKEFGPLACLLAALYAVSARCRLLASTAALLGCAVPLAIQNSHGHGTLVGKIFSLFLEMLLVAAPWALGNARKLADLKEAAAAKALNMQRLRIARELHDIVAETVSVMVLQAAGARAVLATDPRRAEDALDVIQEVGKQSTAELRRLLRLLRSDPADELPDADGTQPGLDDLDVLLTKARAAGLSVSTQTEGTRGQLDPSVSLTAYRLVQESITNTLKHAGPNASVRVNMTWGSDQLTITVEDHCEQRGALTTIASKLSTGHGLLGLRERVAIVGGTISTVQLATGFLVNATLPLRGNNALTGSAVKIAHPSPELVSP